MLCIKPHTLEYAGEIKFNRGKKKDIIYNAIYFSLSESPERDIICSLGIICNRHHTVR